MPVNWVMGFLPIEYVPTLVAGQPGNRDIALPERDWDGNGVLNEQQAVLDSNDS